MTKFTQAELARRFLALHGARKTFLLPNAWDAASARIFEEAGFPAIATTSAGIANAWGYPDGQKMQLGKMLEVVRRIVEVVNVPVTADLEAGYGGTPEAVAKTAREAIAAGAVGMNLEDAVAGRPDTLVDLARQKQIIQAVVETYREAQLSFVLNARTDIFLHSIGPAETRLARALERLNAYRESGAECVFAPGVRDEETILAIVRGLHGPLNILATVGTPPVAALERLGVVRVSLGSGPMRATMGLVTRMARQLREEGSFALMTEGATTYADANQLFQEKLT